MEDTQSTAAAAAAQPGLVEDDLVEQPLQDITNALKRRKRARSSRKLEAIIDNDEHAVEPSAKKMKKRNKALEVELEEDIEIDMLNLEPESKCRAFKHSAIDLVLLILSSDWSTVDPADPSAMVMELTNWNWSFKVYSSCTKGSTGKEPLPVPVISQHARRVREINAYPWSCRILAIYV